MALNGIGGNGGSPLEKFQQIRDLAKKKMDESSAGSGSAGSSAQKSSSGDMRSLLAELLKRKHSEIATDITKASPAQSKPQAERIPPGALTGGKASAADENAMAESVKAPMAYGRAGGIEKQDKAPKLGRYVDFMA